MYFSLLLIATIATAQSKESLLINSGDLVRIRVFDTPELDQQVRVTDAGLISLPLAGDMKVAGETPEDAAHQIEHVMLDKHLLLHPQVSVSVLEYATEKVSILGEVKLPGAYTITTPRSIVDVLTLAGGLSDSADRRITIERHGTKEKVPYFVSNNANTELDTAVMVNPGDSVIVPRAAIVYALGDLRLPGGYTMTNNDGQISVLELVARAGGTNHTAAAAHTKLLRKSGQGYVEMALELKDMQEGKKPDLQLQPNDIIYIPFSYTRNFMIGATSIIASAGDAAIYHF
jgi:polysaccharide biosynthesis/export protein